MYILFINTKYDINYLICMNVDKIRQPVPFWAIPPSCFPSIQLFD